MIKNIWNNYRKIVERHCSVPGLDITGLAYWRNDLFASAVLYLMPLGFIALVPGIYMAYVTDLTLLLFVDTIAVLSFVFIAFTSGVSVFVRKLIFCISLYMVSLGLLYSLGSYGPGLLYLLGITLFIVLIFEEKIALMSVYLNIVVCIIFGIMIYYKWGGGVIVLEYDVISWFAVSSSLILLSAVAVLLIPRLFRGLESAFEKRNQLELELKQNQADLEEKNREMENFAYIASHDLKEPLRMVRSFIDLLSKNYGHQLDKKAQKYIHFALDGANRMTSLIDELLEYSRVGRVHNEREQVDLNSMIPDLLKDLPEAKEADILFENLPEIRAVPVSMKILFRNLISNGLKYQDDGNKPEIKIQFMDQKQYWKFSVSDNGIGIDDLYLEDVFMLFLRLHSNTEYSGSGMGLAISKKIVEQHGGEIWVESKKDEGSTFYFTLEKF